jgi:hypothetical protein
MKKLHTTLPRCCINTATIANVHPATNQPKLSYLHGTICNNNTLPMSPIHSLDNAATPACTDLKYRFKPKFDVKIVYICTWEHVKYQEIM